MEKWAVLTVMLIIIGVVSACIGVYYLIGWILSLLFSLFFDVQVIGGVSPNIATIISLVLVVMIVMCCCFRRSSD